MMLLDHTAEPPPVVVVVDNKATSSSPGKKPTRHWDAWTHEEEESFFVALRHVGKNFDEITKRVQSKNKDQVRHYYYRLIRRINKLLGPEFLLDAKNSKDANSAMLRWWSLMEKQSCSASKLHLKPRRFKTFVTALENQLTRDRKKANRRKAPRMAVTGDPLVAAQVSKRPAISVPESMANVTAEDLQIRKTKTVVRRKAETLQPRRQRNKKSDSLVSTAAFKRWEKAASKGVNLVAEAAEQLERAAAAGQLEGVGLSSRGLNTCSQPDVGQPIGPLFSQPTSHTASDEKVSTEEKQAEKLKLQLFPIDDNTRKSLEQAGLNPHLELTMKPQKSVASVLRHLTQKWGKTSGASGQLQLFPFTAQVKGSISVQHWSSDDVFITAGDLYAALGNNSVFRLRYGWFPPRVLQSSHAEPLEKLASLSTSVVGIESEMEGSEKVILQDEPNQFLTQAHPFSPAICSGNISATDSRTTTPAKSDVYAQSSTSTHQEILQQHGCTQSGTTCKVVAVEQVKPQNSSLSAGNNCLIHHQTTDDDFGNLANTTMKDSGVEKETSLVSLECPNRQALIDENSTFNIVGQGSVGEYSKGCSNKAGHKTQEAGGSQGNCSWLFEGSNDSFSLRLWAVEDHVNSSVLPTEIDWVDSLTNISVGELLNEVSQNGHMLSGVISQVSQPPQSLDSFDAAVAAASAYGSGTETSSFHQSETPAWDGEDTRDAFGFRKVIAQREASVPTNCNLELPSSTEIFRSTDAMAVPFPDCGSLEAWKQSFSHMEVSYPEELKGDGGSRLLQQQDDVGKRCHSQDYFWVS